jgi:hypothetical protein
VICAADPVTAGAAGTGASVDTAPQVRVVAEDGAAASDTRGASIAGRATPRATVVATRIGRSPAERTTAHAAEAAADGAYRIGGLAAGSYLVVAFGDGEAPLGGSVAVTVGDVGERRLDLP